MSITTKCRFPLLCFFKTVLLKSVPGLLTHSIFHSSASHPIVSPLFSFSWQSCVVLPLSLNLSISADPLLHLVGSLLLQQPAMPRGKGWGAQGAWPGIQLQTVAHYPATFNSEAHSLFYEMWSTIQNCCWYHRTKSHILNTNGFYRTS